MDRHTILVFGTAATDSAMISWALALHSTRKRHAQSRAKYATRLRYRIPSEQGRRHNVLSEAETEAR